ncbi:preprotein translocase subunit YajC [Bifidobacterium stellenboschense]|uniref:Preprotein translocase subunit YajC n=1 Tax=Bifidobacterium stellenboschense TaxID=762211 RepID=A0A087DPP6_9BIFI|nr:preprotein translocase subunit YajC [Bifidobacterium stellenboschense]
MDANMLFIVVLVVVMGGMMWFQSKKNKERQQQVKDFRANLQPGTEVITIGQIIGKVVSVDEQYEEIVIDSEGSLLRFSYSGIAKAYERPAFVSDDEVDENGNPLPQDDAAENASGDEAQVDVDASVEQNNAEAETAEAKKADDEKKVE